MSKRVHKKRRLGRCTHMFCPRGWPQMGSCCPLKIQLPVQAAPSTMLESTTCPLPDLVRSRRARTIPRAHVMPPPAKSARRLTGGVGGCPALPSTDRRPGNIARYKLRINPNIFIYLIVSSIAFLSIILLFSLNEFKL